MRTLSVEVPPVVLVKTCRTPPPTDSDAFIWHKSATLFALKSIRGVLFVLLKDILVVPSVTSNIADGSLVPIPTSPPLK